MSKECRLQCVYQMPSRLLTKLRSNKVCNFKKNNLKHRKCLQILNLKTEVSIWKSLMQPVGLERLFEFEKNIRLEIRIDKRY